MVSIELDIAYEGETLEEACEALAAHESVTWAVVNESGPGGGWPVVRFSAPDEASLHALCMAYSDGDARNAEYLMEAHAFAS